MGDNFHDPPDWSASGGEALLKAMLDAADIVAGVVELLENDYRYLVANRNAESLFGLPEGGLAGLTGHDVGLSPRQIAVRLAMLRECVETRKTRTFEYRFTHPGGDDGWYLGTFSALPGEPARVSFVVIDVTTRKQAQIAAESQTERLALALEATGLGIWEYDVIADRVTWDVRMRRLFGVADDQDINFATYIGCIHPDDLPMLQATYEGALAGQGQGRYVVEHRVVHPDGAVRWIRASARVLSDAAGRPARVLGTAHDITDQVTSAERQALLLAELNHRVKNNLAAVQAIASQTLRANHEDPRAFRDAFQGRLFSLARGHDLLTRNAWEAADLADVLDAALSPFNPAVVRLEGPPGKIGLKPDLAVNLVMVLHELATNAAKYGALSREGGQVHVTWAVEAGALVLHWRESGGPPVTPPTRTGFGARLTSAAMKAFGGSAETRFDPAGVTCRLEAPLTQVVVAPKPA